MCITYLGKINKIVINDIHNILEIYYLLVSHTVESVSLSALFISQLYITTKCRIFDGARYESHKNKNQLPVRCCVVVLGGGGVDIFLYIFPTTACMVSTAETALTIRLFEFLFHIFMEDTIKAGGCFYEMHECFSTQPPLIMSQLSQEERQTTRMLYRSI